MLDHFNLPVADLQTSRIFYETVLSPLNYSFLMMDADAVGFGAESWAFGLVQEAAPIPRIHLAFRANSNDLVQQFYRAALEAGARSNGSPDLRPQYGPGYYSAYVFDPDGHNVEAVCRNHAHSAMANI